MSADASGGRTASGGATQAHDGRRRPLLVIDTATSAIVVATARPDGELDGLRTWAAGHRHGETLLPSLGGFLGEQNVRRSRLAAVIVGTGPGGFTGLRVGLATAKGIARALGIPIVGVATGRALLVAAEADGAGPAAALTLLLPAGPWDRVAVRIGEHPRLLRGTADPDIEHDRLVAVDLEGRAPADALARGESARSGLAAALARLGAARLAAEPAGDDLARLVPEYVTLPRGVDRPPSGDVTLSVG
ncbi:MAG TPA: tRNA (adenosine(37)-N6)-threonylcarbamoyltransferase complex dimerization subunit type 1 TsaB [Candidatus Limnocylindrales bacterium]|nr:tRNA (adenosine(37)-N6)-threonylcarbamoyltransferase complex dimerization subunit type 1 TsaB [Candidatus Limnocylindrales bacterium]